MPIQIESISSVLRATGAERAKTGRTIAEGLKRCAETLLKESQKLVPVDTGQLKASGHVEVTGVGLAAQALVVYDAPHAFIVHERLDVFHAPPTQAKYLSAAVPRVRGSMTALLKRNLLVGLR